MEQSVKPVEGQHDGQEAAATLGGLQASDCAGSNLSFDEVNIYSSKSMRLGTHRVLRPVILPYRMTRSSRGYTLYERFEGGG